MINAAPFKVSALASLCALCALLLSNTADAQRSYQRAEADVERLLEDARNAYENFELDQAELDLERAISLIDRYDMRTPLAGDVFVQMGIVVYAKKRDSRRALTFFERAFEADSSVVLDRNSANPSMEKLFESARSRARRSRQSRDRYGGSGGYDDTYARSSGRSRRGADDRIDRNGRYSNGRRDRSGDYGRNRSGDYDRDRGFDRQRRANPNRRRERQRAENRADFGWESDRGRARSRQEKLSHEAMRSAPSDKSLELWVSVDPEINRDIYQLFVYFRSAATTSVQKAVMRAAGATDFRVTVPRRYVVGREFVYYFIAESRTGRKVAALGSPQRPFKVTLSGDILGGESTFASGSSLDYDGGYGDSSYDDDDDSLAFSMGVGSGFGYVTRKSSPVRNKSAVLESEGFAPAVLHLLVELDTWVTDNFSMGAFGRIQVVEYAMLLGGRFQYRLSKRGSSENRLRFGGGYGSVRHLVKIQERFDTTLDGPFCASVGYTYLHRISESMKFKTALDYIQLFGTSPSYHFDLTLGIEVSF